MDYYRYYKNCCKKKNWKLELIKSLLTMKVSARVIIRYTKKKKYGQERLTVITQLHSFLYYKI